VLTSGQPGAAAREFLYRLDLSETYRANPAIAIHELHAGLGQGDESSRLFALAELSFAYALCPRRRSKSIYEIRAGALEDWSHWLAQRGVAAKTRRNVLGGFRSFVSWLRRRELIETIPCFPEIPVDEYAPTLISARVQHQILDQIAWERRGAFLAARLGIRPGEIRAADVTDYRVVEGVAGLTISRAVKGPNANAPTRGTKGRSAAWIPVDEELQR
jgi:hypothetical protein